MKVNKRNESAGETAAIAEPYTILGYAIPQIPKPDNTVEPIMFPQANGMLHGNRPTNDLPVCRTVEGYTCSCWHIPLWKRIKLVWSGNVYLVVKGTTHPPLWIDTEVVWK